MSWTARLSSALGPGAPEALARRLRMPPGPPRARSWIDLLLVVWLGWVYDAMNDLAVVRQRLAESDAHTLLNAERALHLAPEHALNTWLAGHATLSQVTVFWYENVHGVVTIGMLLLVWWLRPDLLRRARAALVLVSAAALAIFWSWPVAPPRMLVADGYVDLVAKVDHQPLWHAGAVAAESNQLAALPSLHLAWGVWASLTLWAVSGRLRARPRRALRTAAIVYPFVTLFAVLATANHFLADAVAGALLALVASVLVDRVAALAGRRRAVREPAVAVRPS